MTQSPSPGAAPGPALHEVNPRLLTVSICEVASFVALVDHGGFTAAARVLHLSQPGISSRVRRLERALGTVLVDRSVRRLTLTAAGQSFLPHARRLLESLGAGWSAADAPDRPADRSRAAGGRLLHHSA